jgi:hypothetical protein
MKSTHTKGEWTTSIETVGIYVKCGDTNICQLSNIKPEKGKDATEMDFEERKEKIEQAYKATEANAKLIAAAPLLYNAAYSALQAIYAMPKGKQAFYQFLKNDLLNAIQKANGTII